TGESEAMVVMSGSVHSVPVVLACFEFAFMGGSMGSVVGERFCRGVQAALENRSPFVCVAASGGARMQESLFSLMQMAKTNAMLTRLAAQRLPFISVLTDPTMGGVSASFAFMGDVVIAEPKALIGFAGPRVIEQTVREKLPEGFQRAEFLLEKGAIDMVVDRREMREELALLLALLMRQPAAGVANCISAGLLSRNLRRKKNPAIARWQGSSFMWAGKPFYDFAFQATVSDSCTGLAAGA